MEDNSLLAKYGKYGLHIIPTPNGRWHYVGTIPIELCVKKKGLFGEDYKSPVFDTKEDGIAYFNVHRPDKPAT